jgi:hypothetical protein
MDQLEMRCPTCGQTIKFAAAHIGRTGKCTACGELVKTYDPRGLVPQPPPERTPDPAIMPAATGRRPVARWVVCLLLAGVVGAGLARADRWSIWRRAGVRSTEWTPLETFRGEGVRATPSFDVPSDEWRVRWDHRCQMFTVTVYQSGVEEFVTASAASAQGPGENMVHAGPGRFWLQIAAWGGPWEVTVDVPE